MMVMKQVTLVFLIREGEILLAMKKRGFGKGKWNGVGGKVELNESLEQAAFRETREEIGVLIEPADLLKVADIKFYFPFVPADKGYNEQVTVFLTNRWTREPIESEEMRPQWFNTKKIPFNQMWSDDKLWLPEVLRGRKILAEFTFDKNEKVEKFKITDLDPFPAKSDQDG